MQVPCGQCIGCRVDKSQDWAARCVHESQSYDENCFITLTYDDENIPQFHELRPEHWQKFMKKLRRSLSPKKLRFFHCGEYGEQTQRPHYHALLFGWEPKDKVHFKTENGTTLYTSAFLEEKWGNGFVTVGNLTKESAAYVARYTLKKLTGERYFSLQSMDFSTGEINELKNVYATMSRRPGIGHDWIKEFTTDVYPDDFIIIEGKQMKTPRFYDKFLERTHQQHYEEIKSERKKRSKLYAADNTPDRLNVREEIAHAKINKLERTL